jgi:cell division protein FtsW (lipid II flippase)
MLIGGTLWGILSNIGFAPMPTAGLNIPFLSYGGSLLVANLALIGIVIGANRRKMLSLFS